MGIFEPQRSYKHGSYKTNSVYLETKQNLETRKRTNDEWEENKKLKEQE